MKTRTLWPQMTRFPLSPAAVFLGLGFFACFASAQNGASQSSRASGVISGSVTANGGEVRALRVQAKDTLNRITYTVYTNKGRYQIFNLPASTYEVHVLEPNFDSPAENVDLKSGERKVANLALKHKQVSPPPGSMDYDQLYPPGPGRDILERECFGCHNTLHDFFEFPRGPGAGEQKGRTEEQWRTAYQRMINPNVWGRWQGLEHPPMLAHPLSLQDQETVLKYLAASFPPGHQKRAWKTDPLVRNEEALSQALYVQYDLPPVDEPKFANSPRIFPGFHDPFVDTSNPAILWLSGTGSNSIFRVDTNNLDFATRTQRFLISNPGNLNLNPHGIIEHRGLVYTTNIYDSSVTEFNPKTNEFRHYAAPTKGGGGHTLRADSEGNIWFTTVYGVSRINRIDAKTKEITEHEPIKNTNYYGILVDKKDRVFASAYSNGKGIPMYDPKTQKWSVFPISRPIRRVTVDPKGRVWGCYYFGNTIVMVDPDTGKTAEYKLPLKHGNPYEIWSDGDGSLWIDVDVYNSLVQYDPENQQFTYFPYPLANGHTPKMEHDADGTLWFGSLGTHQLIAFNRKGNVPRHTVASRAQ